MNEILPIIISTGVITAIITALFGKLSSDKALKIENITKERKEWRDQLRLLIARAVKAQQDKSINDIQLIEAELVVRLNPEDKDDLSILESVKAIKDEWSDDALQEFCYRVSYLLKHDWERVKQESTTKISPQTLAITTLFVMFAGMAVEPLMGISSAFITSAVIVLILFSLLALKEYIVKEYPQTKWLMYLTNTKYRKKYKNRVDRK